MPRHITATHRIQISAPISQCHMFFTPAGEELWVNGWKPNYVSPDTGQTEVGMIFTTGTGAEYTIWCLVDFDRARHFTRYSRVTPGSRAGTVQVRCTQIEANKTDVEVTYALTALSAEGEATLTNFEGEAFEHMIEGWKLAIDTRLDPLLRADIA